MAIGIELRGERGEPIRSFGVIKSADLPEYGDLSYPFLRLVDPYGNTIFSSYQCERAVLDEAKRVAVECHSAPAARLLDAVAQCAGRVHSYLHLIGD
jgi:hypothetical protein